MTTMLNTLQIVCLFFFSRSIYGITKYLKNCLFDLHYAYTLYIIVTVILFINVYILYDYVFSMSFS